MGSLNFAVVEWVAFGLSTAGIILNAKKIIYCWPLWIAANIIWFCSAVPKNEFALASLWVVFIVFNLYGWVEWARPPVYIYTLARFKLMKPARIKVDAKPRKKAMVTIQCHYCSQVTGYAFNCTFDECTGMKDHVHCPVCGDPFLKHIVP